MLKFKIKGLIISLCALVTISCSIDNARDVSEYTPPPPGLIPEYRIGVDDTIQVSVWRNTDLNVTVPVRPDGMISVPLVGDVKAGGLTATAVSKNIQEKLSKFLRDPYVTVIVTGLHSHEYLSRLRITGAVNNQVSIIYRQGMTVLDAILAAGGLNDFAAGNRTRLYRKENGGTVIISIYIEDMLYEGKLETNIELKPGDIITVPERIF